MDKQTGHINTASSLYPEIAPFAQETLSVSDGHRIYVEQCGNPSGIPVVVLHGGPGGGCSPVMRRYFDPKRYHIILFDQRGCGRSRPHASVENNTTWDLVNDIEAIREHLGIGAWVVFGGSWGATLSLIYAQTRPEAVRAIVLRGVFLMTQGELDWFYGGGAGQFWPEVWNSFASMIPEDEHDDLIAAYSRRLFSGVRDEEIRFAKSWAKWENALASMRAGGRSGEAPADYARAFSRLENHYFVNKGFLQDPDHIINNMKRIAHIPGTIVQGRYDMVCPPHSSWRLHKAWPSSVLRMVDLAGHAISEPGITAELVRSTDSYAQKLS